MCDTYELFHVNLQAAECFVLSQKRAHNIFVEVGYCLVCARVAKIPNNRTQFSQSVVFWQQRKNSFQALDADIT